MTETTKLKWFEETASKCSCGKWATGILRGSRNESYGPHCKRCAEKRLRNSESERQIEKKRNLRSGLGET